MTPDPRRSFPDDPLAATLGELVGWWLEVRCACGRTTLLPFLWLTTTARRPKNMPLGRFVDRLRCEQCKAAPARLWLVERPDRSSRVSGVGNSPPCREVVIR